MKYWIVGKRDSDEIGIRINEMARLGWRLHSFNMTGGFWFPCFVAVMETTDDSLSAYSEITEKI